MYKDRVFKAGSYFLVALFAVYPDMLPSYERKPEEVLYSSVRLSGRVAKLPGSEVKNTYKRKDNL